MGWNILFRAAVLLTGETKNVWWGPSSAGLSVMQTALGKEFFLHRVNKHIQNPASRFWRLFSTIPLQPKFISHIVTEFLYINKPKFQLQQLEVQTS